MHWSKASEIPAGYMHAPSVHLESGVGWLINLCMICWMTWDLVDPIWCHLVAWGYARGTCIHLGHPPLFWAAYWPVSLGGPRGCPWPASIAAWQCLMALCRCYSMELHSIMYMYLYILLFLHALWHFWASPFKTVFQLKFSISPFSRYILVYPLFTVSEPRPPCSGRSPIRCSCVYVA